MDERNETQEGGWQQPFVPPAPPQEQEDGAGRPYRRKLIRPEREAPADGRSSGREEEADGRSSGQKESADGRSFGQKESADGHSPGQEESADGRSTGREVRTDGRSAGQEAPADGWTYVRKSSARGRSGRSRSANRRTRLSARDRNGQEQAQQQEQMPEQNPAQQGQTGSLGQEQQRQSRTQNRQPQGQPQGQQQGQQTQGQQKQVQQQGRQKAGQRQGQQQAQDKQPIPASLDELKSMLEREAGLGTSFDVVLREMTFGGRRTALFYMNGLVDSASLTEVLKRLSYLTSEDIDSDALKLFFDTYVPAVQVTKTDSFDDMLDAVLAGNAALFVDRESAVLVIDAKQFPDRTPEEPSLERVVRGSRDGFIETLMTNVSLIRRRLRDKDLRYELIRVGARTKTDVCVAYIQDIADPELVEQVKKKIGQVNVYGLPLADKQLEETTVNLGWHPYPLVRYSERPDVVAAQLLEGSVAVLTDTTPSAILLPTTFFDLTQHAEENRQTPFIGTYLRWVRYIGILFSLFLLPLWFLLVLKPELKPPALDFIGPQQMGRIPLILQFVLAEIGVDLMRMAAVHTPSPLSTAMSLIAAILIGDIAVKTGLFNNEVILYMAVAAIGMFATPNYELGLANRIVRLVLIIAVALFGVPGFVVGTALFIVLLACTRSFNRPYLWPFIPFDGRSLAALLVRPPELQNKKRNPLLKPQQLDRLPDSQNNR